ncbi:hypothetical protein P4131_07650 [Pseudomonas aeruginosa]|nr:hypothetical protein [Pseudomonas aeruginosa]
MPLTGRSSSVSVALFMESSLEWTEAAPQTPWEAPVRSVARFSLDIVSRSSPGFIQEGGAGRSGGFMSQGQGEGNGAGKPLRHGKAQGFHRGGTDNTRPREGLRQGISSLAEKNLLMTKSTFTVIFFAVFVEP